jgi:hypothetical protein
VNVERLTDLSERPEDQPKLTTEQMLDLLAGAEDADLAYGIAESYEQVERVYVAALNVGTFGAAAASTNPR